VQRRPFPWNGHVLTDLVAEIPGKNPALPPVLVTAHLDSTAGHTAGWSASTDPAPGANDDGSGVAIVLDVAAAFTEPGVPIPPRTVRVVLFDGEEAGLRGSSAYLKAETGAMACDLNIDMVGAASEATPRHFWVQYSSGSAAWAALALEASAAFAPSASPIPTDYADTGGSDSDSFWDAGECSVALIAWPRLSVNHTVEDLPAGFDGSFFDAVARSAAAMLAAWAYHGM
jgi:Zn-dependent M28 family amino/carboxypeptidase